MSLRRLGMLQWVGLVAAPLTWAAQHVVGFGVTQAECGAGGMHWGIANTTWQLSMLSVGVLVVLGAEAAAAVVFLRTRGTEEDDPPPDGRLHFLASAALVANLLFLSIMVLDGIGSTVADLCRGG
ncbi:MAG: hypothetical protein JOY72_12310 [Actinobacteria bacterium]|nr:hypothetical protein [Actinomycetota bacterium]MBV8598910.1 hypothetical protein [Actinomycetota bacterium]